MLEVVTAAAMVATRITSV